VNTTDVKVAYEVKGNRVCHAVLLYTLSFFIAVNLIHLNWSYYWISHDKDDKIARDSIMVYTYRRSENAELASK
jgi:hypothetical protein